MDRGLKLVVDVLGSKSAIARLLDIKHQAVMQWSRIPPDHCITLQDACARLGKRVLAQDMRPDVFRDPEVALPAPEATPRPRKRK